jgi:NAD-dependent deacetylase sirtuin 2
MTGAGMSCAAGIPDFRTPGTGLYDNLQKYSLPTPESIFTLEYAYHEFLRVFSFG